MMRAYCLSAALVFAFAALTVIVAPASATDQVVSSAFDSDLDGWTAIGWDNSEPPDGSGTCEWMPGIGFSGGGLHFAGFGQTDNAMNHLREGVYIDKVIPTTGAENIRIMFDLYTHVRGGCYGAGDPLLVDHGDLAEQLTIFYSANGGTDWTEILYFRRTGGNGWEPLEEYNNGYIRRNIDLSGVTAINDNANFALRFRWQFNEGPDAAEGGDWARMDNIIVAGHVIGSGYDTEPPAQIPSFTATPRDGFTTSLTWTTPSTADFAGTMIRYKTRGYPADPADGTLLVDHWSYAPSTTFTYTHKNPIPGRTYYYSAFAYDSTPNYAAAKTARAMASENYWSDSFESPYTLGNLNECSLGVWSLLTGQQNTNQVITNNQYASGGTRSVKIWHHGDPTPSPADGFSNRLFSYTPTNGVAKFHMALMSPRGTTNGNPNNFWYVMLQDTNGNMYGQWYGSETKAIPRDGGDNIGVERPLNPGAWYGLDMVIDTINNKTYCFVDTGTSYSLVFSGTHTAGDAIGRVVFRDYDRDEFDNTYIFIDQVTVGVGVNPASMINLPCAGGQWIADTTPTITWTPGTQESVLKCWVKVFDSDVANPETATPVYSSGEIMSSLPSHTVTTPLPENTRLWAFVKECTQYGGWFPWSAKGNGGFYVYSSAPPTPTVTAPSGTVIGCKPMVVFSGAQHSSFTVKITDAGDVEVWNSGEVSGSGYGAPCEIMLEPGAQYKAYAQIANPAGASSWSAPSLFQVTRVGEGVDVRQMDEEGLLTVNTLPPDDMFGKQLNYNNDVMTLWPEENMVLSQVTSCGNAVMQVVDGGNNYDTRLMRRHRVANIDLNKGITLAFAVAITNQDGTDNSGQKWLQSTSLICDDSENNNRWLVGIRATRNMVGLLTNDDFETAAWQTASVSDSQYKIIRVTGRNKIYNNFKSTEWNLYLNESATPALTATGCMSGALIDPNFYLNWMNDSITLGQGSGGLEGTWEFDWTEVNTAGDYAPGEWNAIEGGAFGGVGAAKALGIHCHVANISGSCVITKVVTHEELQGEPPEPVTVQDGYFVQDLSANAAISGAYIVTSDTQGGLVTEGAVITSLNGLMVEGALPIPNASGVYGGRMIINPSLTIEGTASYPPLATAQRNLIGPCINQVLGSQLDTTCMLVRIFGHVDRASFTGMGEPYFFVDDGSGAVDGREEGSGIRVLLPIDAEIIPDVDDYVMVEGICVYESITGGSYDNVRTILYPTVTRLATGITW